MNTLDLRHSSSTSHLNTTDPLVVLFLIENAEETATNWPSLRDDSLPVFLSSFKRANPGVPTHILKVTTSGKTYPPMVSSDNENAFQEVVFDEPSYRVMSSSIVEESLRTLESYTSQVNNASRHLVLISASCAIDDLGSSGTAAKSLATELHEKEISFHTFMDHHREKTFILDIFSNLNMVNISGGKDGSIQFPAGFCDDWIFRSTVSQNSTMAASLAWTPTLFSLDSVALDANEYQSASNAEIIRKSEETYDWDKLRAIMLQDKQV